MLLLAKFYKNNLVLSLLSGLLFAAAWTFKPMVLTILIAFIPLLQVELNLRYSGKALSKMALYSSVTFLVWNSLTIWWIYYATFGGAVFAIVGNSFLMLIVFYLYFWLRLKSNFKLSRYSLMVLWLAFEFAYHYTEISFPWLNLGNTFASSVMLIQWYEYVGVLGGSALILFVNISLSNILASYQSKSNSKHTRSQLISTLLLPAGLFCYSSIVYHNYTDKGVPTEVVAIQPNIDPYNEKFSGLTDREQLDRILNLAANKITPSTRLVVAPETALTEYMWENDFDNQMSTTVIRNFLKQYPGVAMLIGASTRKLYYPGEEITSTAVQFSDTALFYDRYNTALLYDSVNTLIHHKSRLVLGVEMMPYPQYLKFLNHISIDLGGTVGSLGTQPVPSVFETGNIVAAPVICYESIYGGYVTEYIRQGANLIAIITNDGWWGDTPGYKQHLSFARLRAIETRKSIVRSANTGISCFINQRGDLIQPTEWWTQAAISGNVYLNSDTTVYARYGDSIGRLSGFSAFLLLAYGVFLWIRNRKDN